MTSNEIPNPAPAMLVSGVSNPATGAILGTLSGLASKWAGSTIPTKEIVYTNAAGGAIAGLSSGITSCVCSIAIGTALGGLGAGLAGEEGAKVCASTGIAIASLGSMAAMPAIRGATAKAIFPDVYEGVNAVGEAYKGAGIVAGLALGGAAALAAVGAVCYGTGKIMARASDSFTNRESTRRGQRDRDLSLPL